ncbi:RRXRR domain-containing protein [Nostoc sp. UHCC 0702]|nr:RRXRR domain-containing protein [Nostoc sp. UHCC 0702]
MQRVPVISKSNSPLMPTKASRARRWVNVGKAIGKFNKLGIFYVQLLIDSIDTKTQDVMKTLFLALPIFSSRY